MAVKGEGVASPVVETPHALMIATPQGLSITTSDRWFNQLMVFGPRSQFTAPNYHWWTRYIQTVLRLRNLEDHLTNQAPPKKFFDGEFNIFRILLKCMFLYFLLLLK